MAQLVFARLAERNRLDLQSVHFSGVGVGIAVSSVLIAAVHAAGGGWRADWIAAGLLSLLALPLTALLIERGAPLAGPAAPEPPMPASGSMIAIIFAYGMFGLGYIVTATFLVAIIRQGGGTPLFESLVWLITGLAVLPSVWLAAQLAARVGVLAAYAAGLLLLAFGVIASVTLGVHVGPIIGGLLLGATVVSTTTVALRAARVLAGGAQRRAIGWMTAAFGLGQIVGPVIGGELADRTGSFLAPSILAAAALVLGAVIALRVRLPRPG